MVKFQKGLDGLFRNRDKGITTSRLFWRWMFVLEMDLCPTAHSFFSQNLRGVFIQFSQLLSHSALGLVGRDSDSLGSFRILSMRHIIDKTGCCFLKEMKPIHVSLVSDSRHQISGLACPAGTHQCHLDRVKWSTGHSDLR